VVVVVVVFGFGAVVVVGAARVARGFGALVLDGAPMTGAASATLVDVVVVVVVADSVVVVGPGSRTTSTLTDAALASVFGMLSITRMGSANSVNQTANARRCRGTTYSCRTSASLASRAPSFSLWWSAWLR
jgi:hypothetical protein